ncbi:hypothetical protein A4G99_16570 [Haladaptatus sp. R4]|nr:hypothetical protein A4G99_16570 [Haladaptatus sp. R4]
MDVRTDESLVVCPECGHERSFVQPSLCIVTGAAGTGKTTIRRTLAGRVDAVFLEDDSIVPDECEFSSEETFNEYVLRLCRDVAQSNVPPVLFTTGLGVPENVEGLVNRRYFADSHYLALVCDDDVQADRLRARPRWEGSDYWADVDKQVEFNNWFKDYAVEEGIDLLDTTNMTIEETATDVAQWLANHVTEQNTYCD